jgi:hypothetical protein
MPLVLLSPMYCRSRCRARRKPHSDISGPLEIAMRPRDARIRSYAALGPGVQVVGISQALESPDGLVRFTSGPMN